MGSLARLSLPCWTVRRDFLDRKAHDWSVQFGVDPDALTKRQGAAMNPGLVMPYMQRASPIRIPSLFAAVGMSQKPVSDSQAAQGMQQGLAGETS